MLACAADRINRLYFVVPEPIYDDFMLDRFTILYLTSLMDINLLGHRTAKKTRTTYEFCSNQMESETCSILTAERARARSGRDSQDNCAY